MRQKIAALAAGAVLVAVPVACGNGSGGKSTIPKSASLVPADTIAFAEFVISPSVSQQRNLLGLVQKFPKAKTTATDFTSLKDKSLGEVFKDSGLDYQTDVKPWLGTTVSVAAVKGSADPKDIVPLIFVDTKDDDKARAAMTKAKENPDANEKLGGDFRLLDHQVIIAPSGDKAKTSALLSQVESQKDNEKTSLAKNEAFQKVLDNLKSEHLLLAYADPKGIGGSLNQFLGSSAGGTFGLLGGGLGSLSADFSKSGAFGVDVHLNQSSAVMQGVQVVDTVTEKGGSPKLTAALPADTTAALTVFNLAGTVNKVLQSVGSALNGAFDGFKQSTGLDVNTDILPLFEGETVLVAGPIGSNNIPAFGLITEIKDQAKAQNTFDTLAKLAKDQDAADDVQIAGKTGIESVQAFTDGIKPVAVLLDGKLIIANDKAYAETLAAEADKGLSTTAEFKDVVGAGSNDGTQFQLLVRVAPIRDAIAANLKGSERKAYDRDVAPNVDPIEAVGIRSTISGNTARFEMKVSFK